MKKPLPTQKKFFFRRARIFFLIMMIPTLLVSIFSMAITLNRTERELDQQGQSTVLSVETNCRLIISNVFTQNDILTGTTRMSMALKRSLLDRETSYGDALFLSSLRSELRSIVNTHDYIDSIYIYLDGGVRYFESEQGTADLSASGDRNWLDIYQQMDEDEDEAVCVRTGIYGQDVLTFIKRTIMQQGCAVVNINIANLQKILRTQLMRTYETVTLLRKDGTILIQATNSPWSLPTQADFDALISGKAMTSAWVRGEERTFYHNAGAAENMLVYASADSVLRNELIGSYLATVGWMFALDIAIVFVLAYITTRRSFVQIGSMIEAFEQADKGEPVSRPETRVHDEYDVVMNNIIYMYLKQNHLRSQLQEQQIEKEHSELMSLQLQINPHFLSNTLQTLEMDIRSGKSSRADGGELVRRISEILRYALGDPHKTVSLQKELEYLRKYAAVQEYRFGERFILYYEADDGLEQARVFRLMLQPMVENSMIHGMNGMTERMYIWVRATREGERMRLTVSDTGVGMSEEQLTELKRSIFDAESKAIGLTNLNRRLQLQYGTDSTLTIRSAVGKGTEITFTIPLILEAPE